MFGKQIIRGYSSGAAPQIRSTLLLSRNPVITAELPRFQKVFYKYQKELWRRLMWTFPKYFWFRPGTVAEQRYRQLNKRPAYNNPNFEFVGGRPEVRHDRDRRFKQEIRLPQTYDDPSAEVDHLTRKVEPNSRTTKADETNDLTSLERKLSRSLYLVVSEDGKKWDFPTFAVSGESLHQTAERGLEQIGGPKINYFNVSSTPCHVHSTADGAKLFFIKLHILSGTFAAQPPVKHMWLTREEAKQHLDPAYYDEVEHLMNRV